MRAIGQRYLDENGAVDYITIQHVGIPGLQVGDVVRYINDADGSSPIDWLCMVTEIDMKLGRAAMCTSKLKVMR